MFNIDLQSRIPIYEQVYKKVIELIIKGVLVENEQLPSVRNLSKELNINPNTVAKSYQELERNKIIYSLSGRGSFVAKTNQLAMKEHILEEFDVCIKGALQSGLSRDELKIRIDGVKL